MSESPLEKAIFELFTDIMPLRTKEIKRLAAICSGVLLAGSTHQNAIAKWIHKPISQAGRVMMLRRFLDSAIYTQETVYHPFVAKALETYREPVWHLLIDRTPLEPHVADLLMISLSFRKRAIPLGWEVLDFGSTSGTTQIALIERVKPLIPANQAIILHETRNLGLYK